MKLGARVLKTGLAITLSMYIAILIGFKSPSGAAVAATFAIQPSVYRSWQSIVENVQGNVIGAIVAILMLMLLGTNPILIGLAVIIVIALHLKLRIQDTIPLSIVTIILMMSGVPAGEGVLTYALSRLSLILIGVFSAFIVNLVFLPPNYDKRLYELIFEQTNELFNWIRLTLQHTPDRTSLKNELKQFQDNRYKIAEYFLWYKEERTYFKKVRYARYRKGVIFRQMMMTTNKLNDVLRLMSEYENLPQSLPDDLKADIKERIEGLMMLHEGILLRYNRKIRKEPHEKIIENSHLHKAKLAKSFFDYYEAKKDNESLQLFPLIATLVEYGQCLEHLDRLVDSFQTFHVKENKKEE
ncbi:aromatic acid exporter family protein [Pullulanibacillus sp. KACC 23026]|uniref:FUSC family protein n=1 Tax=Pullulanibacillus sp. KACC 23026 TaxID=3028315 RepID=UPI0023B147E9|nr:aromatic acid exporter family protein [Pullulanibacillus sp. KACC 23026]WEG12269.1 aromatic acid exporter family protein [Pullulanibacillus sp. KACC 23026]